MVFFFLGGGGRFCANLDVQGNIIILSGVCVAATT